MFKPFLELLGDGKEHTLDELKKYISSHFRLSKDDLGKLVSSGSETVFSNRVGWARTYLKKAGLINSPARATFILTQEGKKVLKERPAIIDVDYLEKYESFRAFKTAKNEKGPADKEEDTPEDALEKALSEINMSLADDLLGEVMKLSPTAFEKMVIDLMAKMGYGTYATVTAAAADEGIDGIIMEDKLGFNLIYVQAKRWGEDHLVSRPEIQSFVGAIAGKGGKGLFVTTSKFTKPAMEYAETQHIILMDGNKLAEYMIEHNFGVNVRKSYAVKSIDTDVFNDYLDF